MEPQPESRQPNPYPKMAPAGRCRSAPSCLRRSIARHTRIRSVRIVRLGRRTGARTCRCRGIWCFRRGPASGTHRRTGCSFRASTGSTRARPTRSSCGAPASGASVPMWSAGDGRVLVAPGTRRRLRRRSGTVRRRLLGAVPDELRSTAAQGHHAAGFVAQLAATHRFQRRLLGPFSAGASRGGSPTSRTATLLATCGAV